MIKKAMLLLSLVAMTMYLSCCGSDEKDEPEVVPEGTYASVYTSENDTHYEYTLDMEHQLCTITVHNVVFTIGERQSPAMTIRIPNAAIVSTSHTGAVTIEDTNIAPEMLRGSDFVPMPDVQYIVTDLRATLNAVEKTFAITFKCHGGEFSDTGKLQ
ncbi:MAG: hypothetical protein IJT30_09665 [Muribaculaceae bacterium]|nr:hypothetical protein [Muribaculaceae bacterium]